MNFRTVVHFCVTGTLCDILIRARRHGTDWEVPPSITNFSEIEPPRKQMHLNRRLAASLWHWMLPLQLSGPHWGMHSQWQEVKTTKGQTQHTRIDVHVRWTEAGQWDAAWTAQTREPDQVTHACCTHPQHCDSKAATVTGNSGACSFLCNRPFTTRALA